MKLIARLPVLAAILFFASCHSNDSNDKKKETEMKEPKLKEESIKYSQSDAKDSVQFDGFVVYDENIEGKRPAVLVIHEWWGFNDYVKMRARELAKLGYIAMAIDLYGNGKRGDDPKTAGELATPFYKNPNMAKERFDAAWAKLKTYSQTDASKAAVIGYCFGGAMALTMAKLGEDLKGAVSFHGNLNVVPADKNLLKAQILVCHGADDSFVPAEEVATFKKQMDSIGAKYTFKSYPGATHAFTNPNATETGKKFNLPISYNAAADTASWNDMKEFFGTIFK